MRWPLEPHVLDATARVYVGRLPDDLLPDPAGFDRLWAMHPSSFHVIRIHGKQVPTPRWQQAYGADYKYSGSTYRALPVPPELSHMHDRIRDGIDARLNGLLLNWYEPANRHYIGKHRDSTANMIAGAPIVTISLGGARVFRLRRFRGDRSPHDIPTGDGTVIVMPYDVNLAWTHEVPHTAKVAGRRISITARAFASESI